MAMRTNRRDFLRMAPPFLALPRLIAQSSELSCDVAVIGGGTGGFAAALAALRNGLRVILTEETDWIGGQLTAQAVTPDEHPWIEEFGCTRSYREYRAAVRDYYREHYPLTESAPARPDLNPGNGSVSRLTHEFRVSVAVLESLLLPYIGSGQLTLLLAHVPEAAATNHDRVTNVTVLNLRLGRKRTIERVENLLPACKNIGTTHITNGCYRLHPVEWNIGEAAGALAAYAYNTKQSPRAVRNNGKRLEQFQARLRADGFELAWPRIHPV